VEDNHHHGTVILHDFEDPFLLKKSAKDDSFKFFEFISLIISTWAQHVLQGMSKPIPTRILEDLHESMSMNYGSMVYVYGWMMEEHQPIGIDYQLIRDDDYIEDSMTQDYMGFNEDRRGKIIFWDHTFPKQSLYTTKLLTVQHDFLER